MINARPNNNGNTKDHFTTAAHRLFVALREVDEAVSLIATDVVHGRNYQHLSDGIEAHRSDVERLNQVREMRNVARVLITDILHAVEAVDRNWDDEASRTTWEG